MSKLNLPQRTPNEILDDLIFEKKLSNKEAAQGIGISEGSLSDLRNSNRAMNSDTLKKVCKYFDISADYILGISEVSSTDPDDKAICEKIGCSEEAYNSLKNAYSSLDLFAKDIINAFLIEFNNAHNLADTTQMSFKDHIIDAVFDSFFYKKAFSNRRVFVVNDFDVDENGNPINVTDIQFQLLLSSWEKKSKLSEYELFNLLPEFIYSCAKTILSKYSFDFENWSFLDNTTKQQIKLCEPGEIDPYSFDKVFDLSQAVNSANACPEWAINIIDKYGLGKIEKETDDAEEK